MSLDSDLFHAGSMCAGGLAYALMLKHRGDYSYDKQRKVNVAEGNGYSKKIIEKHPKYRHLSSAVDHFFEGIAGILLIGGIAGMGGELVNAINGQENMFTEVPIRAYGLGIITTGFKKFMTEAGSLVERKKFTFNDGFQVSADLASISLTANAVYYLANQLMK